MTKSRKALLTLLALALIKRPMDLLLSAMLPDASVNPLPGYAAAILVSALLLGLPAWKLRPWTSPRLPRQMPAWLGVGMGVGGALLCALALPPLDGAWQSLIGAVPAARILPESWGGQALMLLTLAFVPAVMEEVFFRGALLTSLMDGSRRVTAILLTALAFALMHASAGSLPSLLVLSLLLTLLMLRTGQIAVPMAAHLTYNLMALKGLTLPLWGSILCGAGLIALTAGLCLHRPRVAHPPMNRPDRLIAAGTLLLFFLLYFV